MHPLADRENSIQVKLGMDLSTKIDYSRLTRSSFRSETRSPVRQPLSSPSQRGQDDARHPNLCRRIREKTEGQDTRAYSIACRGIRVGICAAISSTSIIFRRIACLFYYSERMQQQEQEWCLT